MQSAPGRIVEVVGIDLPRPRDAALFSAPHFHELCDRIAGVLHGG
jgi:NitT/TauT family transport system ATP-binding protein